MDILNSPLILVIVILGLIALTWFKNRSSRKRKCDHCGKGTMQQTEVVPEGVMNASNPSHSTTTMRVKVKYQCTNCEEFAVVTETRR